jgi:sulfite reductase alpha subunit-like flavoprotein
VQLEELDYLRGKLASMDASNSDTFSQLRDFEGSPGAAQLQQPVSAIEAQTKSLVLLKSDGSGNAEHLALKAASEAIEQCVNTRSQALDEIKGSTISVGLHARSLT